MMILHWKHELKGRRERKRDEGDREEVREIASDEEVCVFFFFVCVFFGGRGRFADSFGILLVTFA